VKVLYSEKFMSAVDTLRMAAWVRCWFPAFGLALCALAQPVPQSQPPAPSGELIQATGQPEIYLLTNGTKYHIETPSWIGQNGFGGVPIRVLTASEVDAIPNGYPLPEGSGLPGKPGTMALEGKLLQDKEGRIYAVIHGRRHWILDAHWIAESPFARQGAIRLTDSQLEAVPLGGNIEYTRPGQKIALPLLAIAIFAFFFLAVKGKLNWLDNGWKVRAVLAIVFIAAMGLREPYLLQHPRFWAEEGLVWFQYGSTHSIFKTLLFVFPVSNYFNLTPNIGAVLSSRVAAHFGLLYAPVATTLLAFFIQAAALVAILFVKSRLFDSCWKAVAGCLILLFASTTSDEIWLNSINAMSFLGAITLVLLFAETEGWRQSTKWTARAALLFCGFSSPYAVAMLPAFLIRAWHSKGREQKIQCLILILCVVVQAGVVLKSRRQIRKLNTDPMRATAVRPDASAVNMFVEHMLYPAVGFSLRERVLDFSGLKEPSVAASSFPPRPLARTLPVGGWLSFLLILGILFTLRGPSLFSTTNMVLSVFLVLSIFTCLASLYSVPTGRYAFLPGVSFLLLLLMNIDSPKSQIHRYACMSVLAYGLAAGMVAYQTPNFQEGPPWKGEVEKWESNPAYSLRVWPSFFVSPVNITYPKRAGAK